MSEPMIPEQTAPEAPELTLMKAKIPAMKLKLNQPFPYFYHLTLKDTIDYQQKLVELKERLKISLETEALTQYIPMILGRVEGMSGELSYSEELGKFFDLENKDFWDNLVKDKVALKYFGNAKQKSHSLYECKDIEGLKDIYDTEELKKNRKITKQHSGVHKAISKFLEKFDKCSNQSEQTEELYEEYKKVEQEESKMAKLLLGDKKAVKQNAKSEKIQVPVPIEVQPVDKIQEEEGLPLKEDEKIENSKKEEKNDEDTEKKMDVEKKEEEKLTPIKKKVEKVEKEKKGEKAAEKTENKEKEQTSNKKEKQPKPLDKKQMMISQNTLLDRFMKKEQKPEPVKEVKPEEINIEEETTCRTDVFLEYLNRETRPEISSLQNEFKSSKKVVSIEVKTCYINIIMKRSRLEYYDFPVGETKVDFIDPCEEKEGVRYDDSSDEYSELVADSINEEMMEEDDEEEEEEESNSAIVPDDVCEYRSDHVFSSDESEESKEEMKPKMQITKNIGKWSFSYKEYETTERWKKYEMICLTEETFPLITKDANEDISNEVTGDQKIEMYKEIHGSFTPKDVMIRKLNTIVDNKISMNKLSTMIKDICSKKGTQRVLKPEIIKEIAEEYIEINPNLEAEFEKIQKEREEIRNKEVEEKKEGKMNERDQKIEKEILEYEGPFSTNAILEYLKSKEVKILKQELSTLIKTKVGEQWEKIRDEIKKTKLQRGRPKIVKVDESETIKSSHRPIDEILKQNELEMANKPKKIKPQKDNEMIDEAEEEEEENFEDQEDESFDLKNKKKKQGKKQRKTKKIVMMKIDPTNLRKNPPRNKSKKNRGEKTKEEKENKEKDNKVQENEEINEESEENQENQENQENEERNIDNLEQSMEKENVNDNNDVKEAEQTANKNKNSESGSNEMENENMEKKVDAVNIEEDAKMEEKV